MRIQTYIIFASGPSLTSKDCKKAINAGIPTIAVNSTWEAIPECDYIYAGDCKWWDIHFSNLPSAPEKWTSSEVAHNRYGINYHHPQYIAPFNSGVRSIMFAISLGAKNIILSGFDCSIENGLHWHGEHSLTGNPTPLLINLWQYQFLELNNHLSDEIQVINCSRQTSLTCFKKASFEECIEQITLNKVTEKISI